MALIIIGFILFIISFVLILIGATRDKTELCWPAYLLGTLAITVIWMGDEKRGKNSEDYSIKTEIKTKTLNGVETKRDTVYYFIPKNQKQ